MIKPDTIHITGAAKTGSHGPPQIPGSPADPDRVPRPWESTSSAWASVSLVKGWYVTQACRER